MPLQKPDPSTHIFHVKSKYAWRLWSELYQVVDGNKKKVFGTRALAKLDDIATSAFFGGPDFPGCRSNVAQARRLVDDPETLVLAARLAKEFGELSKHELPTMHGHVGYEVARRLPLPNADAQTLLGL